MCHHSRPSSSLVVSAARTSTLGRGTGSRYMVMPAQTPREVAAPTWQVEAGGPVGPMDWPGLSGDHDAQLAALQGGAVSRRLPIIQIQHGAQPTDAIGMPVAAWLLGETLLHWAARWQSPEVPHPRALAPALASPSVLLPLYVLMWQYGRGRRKFPAFAGCRGASRRRLRGV